MKINKLISKFFSCKINFKLSVNAFVSSILHTIYIIFVIAGISYENQNDVLSLTAAILHIGNIGFVESGNYAAIENEDCKFHATTTLVFYRGVLVKIFIV